MQPDTSSTACSHTVRGTREQCQLPAGHEGDHIAPSTTLQEEHEQLQARFGVLLSFARPVDIQAAERWIEEHGLVDAEGNPLGR